MDRFLKGFILERERERERGLGVGYGILFNFLLENLAVF